MRPPRRQYAILSLVVVAAIYFIGLASNLLSLRGARQEVSNWVASTMSTPPRWVSRPFPGTRYPRPNRFSLRVPVPPATAATLPTYPSAYLSSSCFVPFLVNVEYTFVDTPSARPRSGGGVRFYASFFGFRRIVFMQDETQFN